MSSAFPGYFIEKLSLPKIHQTGFSFSVCFEALDELPQNMEETWLKWEYSAALSRQSFSPIPGFDGLVPCTEELLSLDFPFCWNTAVLSSRLHGWTCELLPHPSSPGCSWAALLSFYVTQHSHHNSKVNNSADSPRVKQGISRSKSCNMNISFCFDFFFITFPLLCVWTCWKTGWSDCAHPEIIPASFWSFWERLEEVQAPQGCTGGLLALW